MSHSARRLVAGATLLAFLPAACGGRAPQPQPPQTGGDGTVLVVEPPKPPDGLELVLSEGKPAGGATPALPRPDTTPLTDAQADAILKRAQPLPKDPGDSKPFALRPRSAPPPKPGQIVDAAFPPPPSSATAPAVATGPLTVLRYQPSGAVDLAPQLSVTFSQPMIAVTSQDVAAKIVPVTLSPTPPGQWRWLGTRTLIFDPEVRFPQATTYQVEIPAGTKSATGGALGQAVRFSFETPAPKLVGAWPSGDSNRVDTPIVLAFDQRVDAAQILAAAKLEAGGKPIGLRAATVAELAAHPAAKATLDASEPGRAVALAPVTRLPVATEIRLTLPAGTPSAEGPNPTGAAQTHEYRTFGKLSIVDASCGWGGPCRPETPFVISFSNALDAEAVQAAWATVTPAIPGIQVVPQGYQLLITGATAPRTRYDVVLAATIRDAFGQTLGQAEKRSFQVDSAEPRFFAPEGMVVADPAAKLPTFDVWSTNFSGLKVQLYAVTPAEWVPFQRAMRQSYERDRPATLPGKRVVDTTLKVASNDTLVQTQIDLAPALSAAGLGHVLVSVEPTPWPRDSGTPRPQYAWVQVTRLGLSAHLDGEELVAMATALADGKAAGGVALTLDPGGTRASTGADGLARFTLPQPGSQGTDVLLAQRGDDTAFLTSEGGWWSDTANWVQRIARDQLLWYVTDDRSMYRPGETVRIKGWLRSLDLGKGGDLGAPRVASLRYEAVDAQEVELGKGQVKVGPAGSFDLAIKLPGTPNLGGASVRFYVDDGQPRRPGADDEFDDGDDTAEHWHAFQIQEFARPEFEVTAKASNGALIVGEHTDVTASARYYAGGGLAGAPVRWEVQASSTSFTPPGRDDYVFGEWQPWWWGRGGWGGPWRGPSQSWSFEGKTDGAGDHVLRLEAKALRPAHPMSLTAYPRVEDVNRREWSTQTALLVHPAAVTVGLRSERGFVERGQPIDLAVIGVDLDGKAAIGAPIEVVAERLTWVWKAGQYVEERKDRQACALAAAADPGRCQFTTAEGGTYAITATIVDGAGRKSESSLSVWVSGGDQPPSREVTQEQVQLIPGKQGYVAGDTAEILVQAPFFPAEGLVTWRRSGIVHTERVSLTTASTTIRVPLTDAMVPGVLVRVDLVGSAPRVGADGQVDPSLPRRPGYAAGELRLTVPPTTRTLRVEATPRATQLSPGERTTVDVLVRDHTGRPVAGSEVALFVVDEAILALSQKQFQDPVSTFYGERDPGAYDVHSRAQVRLADPRSTSGAKPQTVATAESAKNAPQPSAPPAEAPMDADRAFADAPTGGMMASRGRAAPGGGGRGPQAPAVMVRRDFDPLAHFAAAVATGADGRAAVAIKVPDNLTRYRVVALASAGERQFGKGESAVTARLPLMVRPAPPRFLNFGDTFELPIVLQNQTSAPMTVQVAARGRNLAFTAGRGRQLVVPANDRVEVRLPAAAQAAGTARVQIVAQTGGAADAAELSWPVWTPATTEAFATYGVLDGPGVTAIRQPVALPEAIVPDFGGLELQTSSTQLQALTDAVLYLTQYPFECSEQRASRVLAIAALRDVLTAFAAPGLPAPAALEASVVTDLERLASIQNDDGGFPFWRRGFESWPYLTVHVTRAMVAASAKGFPVPKEALANALGYLREIEQHYPAHYGEDVRASISSYALYVRKLAGERDVKRAQKLLARGVAKLPLEASGWLLGALTGEASAAADRAKIVAHLGNQVTETAGAANFTTGYSDGAHLLLASDRRTDAVVLESMIVDQPTSDLLPKLVAGLLAHKKAGRWESTSENAFVLLALDAYFQAFEKTTPDFVARAWLGNGLAAEQTYRGRSTATHKTDIPMGVVASLGRGQGVGDLTLAKDGDGRLYYRLGMTYAPKSLALAAADRGFVVDRRYEAIDAADDVRQAADGTWEIKAGARVRVRLQMVAENRRYHVALVDPLPAGLEPLNPVLAVTGPVPQDPKADAGRGGPWWWWSTWYEHQNLRDERVEAFTTLLWEGVHEYTYVARATTPGTFVVPPAKAEEMYSPETFGRSASAKVVIR